MWLNLDLLAMVIGSGAILAIGAFAWRRNLHSRSVRFFFIATIAFASYLITNYFQLQHFSPYVVDEISRSTYASGLILLAATWYFCISFPIERKPPRLIQLAVVVISLGGSILAMTTLVVKHSIQRGSSEVVIKPGPLYWEFSALLVICVIAAMLHLRANYMVANRLQRNQIRYVAFGILMGTSIAILFNIALVLINPAWGTPEVNALITLLTVVFLGYGFIRHRYIDVHQLAAWLFTYVASLLLIGSLLLAVFDIVGRLYPDSSDAQTVGLLLVATMAVMIIQPINQQLKRTGDRLFNVGWYDSQALMNSLGTMLAGELHLDPLLNNVLQAIGEKLQVVNAELLVLDDKNGYLSVLYGDWSAPPQGINISILPNIDIAIADELSIDDPVAVELAKQSMRVSVPLLTRGRRVGYLLLGIKTSGDIFSDQDVDVLRLLANQLAVAIVSVQSFEQITRFNTNLQQEITKATVDLQAAHRKLQLDDEMKTEFISLTSHNLRTPLAVVKGYMSMLEEGQLTDKQRGLITPLNEGIERLSQLIENLLSIDSIVSGEPLTLQPTKLEDVLAPLIQETSQLAESKNIQFVTKLSLAGVSVKADPDTLKSAIGNLLNNACKFTYEGTVTLSAASHGDSLEIVVADTGIGIAKEELPNLFTKFHRATDTLAYNFEGVGIGLYLTNLIVRAHGGRIYVVSTLQKGSTFTISLPLSDVQSSPQIAT